MTRYVLAAVAALALAACEREPDPADYSGLYAINGSDLSCPTADKFETWSDPPGTTHGGDDTFAWCWWACHDRAMLSLTFRRNAALGEPWRTDLQFAGDACLPWP